MYQVIIRLWTYASSALLLLATLYSIWITVQQQRATTKVSHQRDEIAQLRHEVRFLSDELKTNRALLSKYATKKPRIEQKTRAIIKRIQAKPKTDDAPLAPVLRDALELIE